MSCGNTQVITLREAASSYQTDKVIPHCSVCARPCCKLDALVLEMNWKQVKVLWNIDEARTAFDKRLAAGKGPVEIRESYGLYYIHTRPCPAYDEAGHACRVYGQAIKPAGCSDFPVYEDGGHVVADLRCEAVNVVDLVAWIQARLGPAAQIVQSADRDFPFLVTLSIKPPRPARARRPAR